MKRKVSKNEATFIGQIVSVMTKRMFGLADAVDKSEDSKELVTEYLSDIAVSVSVLVSHYDIEYSAVNERVASLLSKSKEELGEYLSDVLKGTDVFEIESSIEGPVIEKE